MKIRLLTSAMLTVFLMVAPGCKKSEPVAVKPPPASETPPVMLSNGLPAQRLTVQAGDDINAILDNLTKELRRWVRRNQRAPASFEEFVSSAQLQPPPPPSGKKYVINSRMAVVLASR